MVPYDVPPRLEQEDFNTWTYFFIAKLNRDLADLWPKEHKVADRPAPGDVRKGTIIWVTDATAGEELQVSDGVSWKYIARSALT